MGITRWLHCANVVERVTVGITRWLHCANVVSNDDSGDNTVASLC